ncbi:MAG: aldehyde dehydrogenase family protein, partial [Planctomycetota bacterium]
MVAAGKPGISINRISDALGAVLERRCRRDILLPRIADAQWGSLRCQHPALGSAPMKQPSKLRSFVLDQWHVASSGWVDLHDPVSEVVIARASSAGVDFGAVLEHARERGGPALRAMTLAERGSMLRGLSKALRAARDDLVELSVRNTGTPVADARFDIDGAVGTLAYYGSLARQLEGKLLRDGEGLALAETDAFWGSHVRVPLRGAAVQINAFNFPA